jgi:hypothetical protein
VSAGTCSTARTSSVTWTKTSTCWASRTASSISGEFREGRPEDLVSSARASASSPSRIAGGGDHGLLLQGVP